MHYTLYNRDCFNLFPNKILNLFHRHHFLCSRQQTNAYGIIISIQNYADNNRTENTIHFGVVSKLKASRIPNGIDRSLTNILKREGYKRNPRGTSRQ